jgi:hypothetical protein
MATRGKLTPEERIAEYVDSPLMTQRVRRGKKELLARIEGNYGVYHARASLSGTLTGECTCPSDWYPCKHIQALRKTWKVNPESFLDLDEFVKGLSKWPKAGLIEAIRQIVLTSPESLSVFGVSGFEEQDDSEDDDWVEDDDGERDDT